MSIWNSDVRGLTSFPNRKIDLIPILLSNKFNFLFAVFPTFPLYWTVTSTGYNGGEITRWMGEKRQPIDWWASALLDVFFASSIHVFSGSKILTEHNNDIMVNCWLTWAFLSGLINLTESFGYSQFSSKSVNQSNKQSMLHSHTLLEQPWTVSPNQILI